MPIITLTKPIKRGTDEITEIVLREPTGAGELRGLKLTDLQAFDVGTVLVLAKRLTTTPLSQEEINAISPQDLVKIGTAMMDFF